MKLAVQSMYDEAQVKNKDSKEYISQKLDEILQGKKKDESFFGYFEQYLEVKSTHWERSTLESRKSTLRILKQFADETGYPMTFDDLNMTFYHRFMGYCFDLQRANNTIAGYMRNIKAVLHWCRKQGVQVNPDFTDFIVSWDDSDQVALTIEELSLLVNLDVADNKRLENVRDLFLLGCYTALRISDLMRLRAENITHETIKVRVKKTSEILEIPLIEPAKAIIARYPLLNFRRITAQKFNDYIHEVCRMAGISDQTLLTLKSGTQTLERKGEKWEFVSSHAMRRTFVSIALELGLGESDIMKMTGHKSYKDFKKYNKRTTSAVAQTMNEKMKNLPTLQRQ